MHACLQTWLRYWISKIFFRIKRSALHSGKFRQRRFIDLHSEDLLAKFFRSNITRSCLLDEVCLQNTSSPIIPQPRKKYGNAQITRPYLGQQDKQTSKYIFDKFKLLFSNKKIVIVEGEYTRFGVGNDLLQNAKSIKRIIVPAVNAFSSYRSILLQTLKMDVDSTYLLSIGPTAKILAYDLFNTGRRVFDVGHLDLEYEWFLRCANHKINIPGKYVNESSGKKFIDSPSISNDKEYLSQIVCTIS